MTGEPRNSEGADLPTDWLAEFESESRRDWRNARIVRGDDNDLELPRLIALPPVIAPVVPSSPRQRRRARRIRSLPKVVIASLGLIATVAGLVAAGAFVIYLLQTFG